MYFAKVDLMTKCDNGLILIYKTPKQKCNAKKGRTDILNLTQSAKAGALPNKMVDCVLLAFVNEI